jgi:hypothetical protein
MLHQEGLFPYSVPREHAAGEPGPASRAIARLRWFSLDGRLVAGEDPARSKLLAAQAARLTAARHRETLAAALNGLLLAAEQGPGAARVRPSRDAVLRNASMVRELARRVDSRETLYARGLARLELLLSDSTGPAYRGSAGRLSAELARVDDELSGVAREAPPRSAGRGRSLRRLARVRSRDAAVAPGLAGSSFALPDGSWFHGRRDAA